MPGDGAPGAAAAGAPAGEPPAPAPAEAPVPASDDPDANESATAASSRVPLAEIRRYVAVYNAVKEVYVDPVE
ncbi:hypothetical protein ACTHT3_18425, partial [Neisseria sp. P0015.S004]